MQVFQSPGPANTQPCAAIAAERAAALGCPIVLSSNTGSSAWTVLEQLKQRGCACPVIVVRNASSAANGGVNFMDPGERARLEEAGCTVVGAANALSAGERALSTRFQGIYPLELMAYTLRMFGQGMKVCVECATMAQDADAIPFGRPVVAVGGTGRGLDTAVVITPSFSSSLLDAKIHEILCKPGLYPQAQA